MIFVSLECRQRHVHLVGLIFQKVSDVILPHRVLILRSVVRGPDRFTNKEPHCLQQKGTVNKCKKHLNKSYSEKLLAERTLR